MRRQILTAKSGISNHAVAGMDEIREFCFKEFAVVCLFWNFLVRWYSCNITYQSKERYSYCGNSFLSPLLFQQPQKDFSPLHFFRLLISVCLCVQQRIF